MGAYSSMGHYLHPIPLPLECICLRPGTSFYSQANLHTTEECLALGAVWAGTSEVDKADRALH